MTTNNTNPTTNPFAARIRARLRSKGGQHRPTSAADSRRIQSEQPGVDLARANAELDRSIEPNPF